MSEKQNKFTDWKKETLSFSSMKKFSESPDHFISYKKQVFEPTDAMLAGQLVHALILEPETVADKYAIYEGKTRRGKEWDEFKHVAEHNKKTIIRKVDFDAANVTSERILKNDFVSQMLDGKSGVEKLIEWTDERTGVKLKGFADVVGDTWFADFKSGADTDPDKFSRNAYDQKLPLQCALYFDGLRANGIPVDEMFIIRFGMTEPFPVVIYKPTKFFIEYGHAMKRRLLDKWIEWNGFPAGIEFHTGNEIQSLKIPRWAKPEPDMIKIDPINKIRE
tara:strand:- start:4470 stop:5300 length:831 start_codon:yes stop_codon:yes gene_type:complete